MKEKIEDAGRREFDQIIRESLSKKSKDGKVSEERVRRVRTRFIQDFLTARKLTAFSTDYYFLALSFLAEVIFYRYLAERDLLPHTIDGSFVFPKDFSGVGDPDSDLLLDRLFEGVHELVEKRTAWTNHLLARKLFAALKNPFYSFWKRRLSFSDYEKIVKEAVKDLPGLETSQVRWLLRSVAEYEKNNLKGPDDALCDSVGRYVEGISYKTYQERRKEKLDVSFAYGKPLHLARSAEFQKLFARVLLTKCVGYSDALVDQMLAVADPHE